MNFKKLLKYKLDKIYSTFFINSKWKTQSEAMSKSSMVLDQIYQQSIRNSRNAKGYSIVVKPINLPSTLPK